MCAMCIFIATCMVNKGEDIKGLVLNIFVYLTLIANAAFNFATCPHVEDGLPVRPLPDHATDQWSASLLITRYRCIASNVDSCINADHIEHAVCCHKTNAD